MKILITGSRSIKDRKFVEEILEENVHYGDTIIHGGAIGVDTISHEWAKSKGINSIAYPPIFRQREWYLRRNCEMVGACDIVLAIWDGESTGTIFTINYAKHRAKKVIMGTKL